MPKPSSFALQSGNALATGLLRAYGFGEGSGSVVRDYSGNAADLTLRQALATMTSGQSAAAWTSDATYGAGVIFNGTDQDARGGAAGLPTGAAARTFALQVKLPIGATNYFFGYGTNADGLFGLGVDAGKLRFTTNSTGFDSTGTVADGAIRTVAITYDGSDLRYYVDGAAAGTNAFGGLPTGPATYQYLGQIGGTGGGNSDGSQGLNCACTVYGEQAWSRALSPTEIASLQADFWQAVRASAPAFPPPLVPYLGRRRAG